MEILSTISATLRSGFSLAAIGRQVFEALLTNITEGQVHLVLPDKTESKYGEENAKLRTKITVLDNNFFARLVKSADIGFAEAYIMGEITVDNLTTLLKIFIFNRDRMNGLDTNFAWFGHLLDKFSHWQQANSLGQAQDNVAAHYDLSNDLFQTFLDPTMSYSCAIFKSDKETLEQAQMNKIRTVIDKAKIKSTDHVLEIGSGWGALAMEAVRRTGCRVTSITLSVEQKQLADKRIAEAGLSDHIEIKLIDYRQVEGQFDKIISVEMIEQVGHEFLPVYFKTIERLLKPNGIAVIQAITMPDFRYDAYLKSCDFIQKYIFPGTVCPSITAMVNAISGHTQLILYDLENIGAHYARTLRMWNDNLKANVKRVAQLGFDDKFMRTWDYYFCYCEAGFATRTLGDVHMVLSRTCNLAMSEGVPE